MWRGPHARPQCSWDCIRMGQGRLGSARHGLRRQHLPPSRCEGFPRGCESVTSGSRLPPLPCSHLKQCALCMGVWGAGAAGVWVSSSKAAHSQTCDRNATLCSCVVYRSWGGACPGCGQGCDRDRAVRGWAPAPWACTPGGCTAWFRMRGSWSSAPHRAGGGGGCDGIPRGHGI